MAKKKEEGGMPATGAGLIRYFDEETEGIKMSPYVAIGICITVGVVVILLQIFR